MSLTHSVVNFVPYFAWAGAEIAVAMVCLGVPTLRPLYLRCRGLKTGRDYTEQARSLGSQLPHFTMVDTKVVNRDPSLVCESASSEVTVEAGLAKPPMVHTRYQDPLYEGSHSFQDARTEIWVQNEVEIQMQGSETRGWPLRN